MQCQQPPGHCLNCCDPITAQILQESVNSFGHALCLNCQIELKDKLRASSRETIKLYMSLKRRSVPAVLQETEKGETEIFILDARVLIEVDEPRNNCNPKRSLADLKQTLGFWHRLSQSTLHIPNELIAYNLEETTDYIEELSCLERLKRAC